MSMSLPHPHRPRWRSLILLTLLLAPLLWPLQQLAERYYSGVLIEQNRQTLDLYVANLLGTLRRYEVLPAILGDLPDLRLALQQPTASSARDKANRLLDQVRAQTGADVIYLMDPDGKTLAASNWDQADSFVDRNFAFRPYFREAIAGRPGRFFGLGTTSGKRGYYFAAAVLMPYEAFLSEARLTKYDFDHLATRFGVSFEQACHRATTLQRDGAQGVPFFFLRIDKGGNVAKRFNATSFPLAEHGGACPRLDVHTSFRTPGRIVPQFVEMPDRSQFFVFARTVDRPTWARHAQDNRLAVAMGCAVEHVADIGYAEPFVLSGTPMTPVGINCRICPRTHCDQRAHQAVVMPQPVNAMRRGATRFET